MDNQPFRRWFLSPLSWPDLVERKGTDVIKRAGQPTNLPPSKTADSICCHIWFASSQRAIKALPGESASRDGDASQAPGDLPAQRQRNDHGRRRRKDAQYVVPFFSLGSWKRACCDIHPGDGSGATTHTARRPAPRDDRRALANQPLPMPHAIMVTWGTWGLCMRDIRSASLVHTSVNRMVSLPSSGTATITADIGL